MQRRGFLGRNDEKQMTVQAYMQNCLKPELDGGGTSRDGSNFRNRDLPMPDFPG